MMTHSVKSIRKLDPHVAKQIAAGEVVERPASIVKELIENSLDAHATKIHIVLEKGGLDNIQIIDNGMGILREELPLALDRHATSKITSIEDMSCIKSLGFRGEALASISAVAHVRLASRVHFEEHGWSIISKAHNRSAHIDESLTLDPYKVARDTGTTLEVKELFYNVPARRRFLRSANTEFAKIQTLVKCFSLSHRNVDFYLTHNKKSVLQLPASDEAQITRACLAKILNRQFGETAIPVSQQEGDLQLTGWISGPDFSRPQPDLQFFYVNQRLIKDKIFTHALKQAYQDILYRGRLPAAVLFLTINPSDVDVNVHPAKLEIRFRQIHRVHDFIYQSLKKTLANNLSTLTTLESTVQDTNSLISLKKNIAENWDPPIPQKLPFENTIQVGIEPLANYSHSNPSHGLIGNTDRPTYDHSPDKLHEPDTSVEMHQTEHSLGRALAQLHGIYILSQNESGLIIVDAHAAHERVIYEKLKKELSNDTLQIQSLLVPLFTELTTQEIELIESYSTLFKQLGFRYEINATRLNIHGIPHLLGNSNILPIIHDILSDLQENHRTHRVEKELHAFLSKVACRSAIHANRILNLEEMNQLLRDIENTPHSRQCNHGRPTWRYFSLQEIDTWFLRGR